MRLETEQAAIYTSRVTKGPGFGPCRAVTATATQADETLEEKGAVSAECAEEMAKGVRTLLDTDIGIATTGIAGPTGGTRDKPVGLVYIALATKSYIYHERHFFFEDREGNKRKAADAALGLLKKSLTDEVKRARSSER